MRSENFYEIHRVESFLYEIVTLNSQLQGIFSWEVSENFHRKTRDGCCL